MSEPALVRHAAGIASFDAVAYTRHMAEDAEGTVHSMIALRREIGAIASRHGGRVVDAPGDNLLAEFPGPAEALACAVEVQRRLYELNHARPVERRIHLRAGVHAGNVIAEGERIYGDDVNIAARLEPLADPGGICLSLAVREAGGEKLELPFEDLGDVRLKHVAAPIHVFRVQARSMLPAGASLPGDEYDAADFGRVPAIAVLPFDDLSADPEQAYFSDGLCEDLITQLAQHRLFPVIARNSSFVYRGRPVDVKRTGAELGARYLVEGSVRRTGSRIRISAQLIDARDATHVWAQNFDRECSDLFAVQDEITTAIVGSMYPQLLAQETRRVLREPPRMLDAWEIAQRGWWYANRRTAEDNVRAQQLFDRAIELDPQLLWPRWGLVSSHWLDLFYQWSKDRLRSGAAVVSAANACMEIDPNDAHAQVAWATACTLIRRRDEAIAAGRRATQLNPSLALAHYQLGTMLCAVDRAEEAIVSNARALRLSPRDPLIYAFLGSEAASHCMAGRWDDGARLARRALEERPGWPTAYQVLGTALVGLDRMDEARAAFGRMMELEPGFTLRGFEAVYQAAAPRFRAVFTEGLRRCGLGGDA
jgi:TolB-like protein/class 3 adenylate cyclase